MKLHISDEQISAAEGLFAQLNAGRRLTNAPDVFVLFGMLLGEIKRLRASPTAVDHLSELGHELSPAATRRGGWKVKLKNRVDGDWELELTGKRSWHRYIGPDLATLIARAHAGEAAESTGKPPTDE